MSVRALLAIALLTALATSRAWADDCLYRIRWEIKPGGPVTLVRANGDSVQGSLVAVEPDSSFLLLRTEGARTTRFRSSDFRAISYVQHRAGGELTAPFALVGAILGGLMGGAVYDPPSPGELEVLDLGKAGSVIVGALIGAGSGALLGSTASQTSRYQRIDCTLPSPAERPNEGAFVLYDVAPALLAGVAPEYPAAAKEAGIQGEVVLHILVGMDGRVWEVRVHRGIPGLNESAVDAVKRWRFQPARRGAAPVSVWSEVRIPFPPA